MSVRGCPVCGACGHPADPAEGYYSARYAGHGGHCGRCHDWTRDAVTQNCPNCDARVTMVPYDIGSGPELACRHCWSCWGADGQPLKPIPPAVMRQYVALDDAIGSAVDVRGPAVELIETRETST